MGRPTAVRVRKLLHYDPKTGCLWWRVTLSNRAVAGSVAGTRDDNGYLRIQIDGHSHKASRLAWLIMTGEWPSNTIDHRDRNPRNNRWSNLRLATYSQNNANRRTHTTTGLKGVRPDKLTGRYQARICSGRQRHLGYFDHPEEAHQAYREAAQRLHGEFANLGMSEADWQRRWCWFFCSRVWID